MITRLIALLRPYSRNIMIALACTLLSSAGLLSVPLIVKEFLTPEANGDLRSALMVWIMLLAGLILLSLFGYASNYLMIRTSQKLSSDLRGHYMDHLLRMPLPFHHNHKIGELIDRMITSVKELEWFTKHNLLSTAGSSVLFLGAIAMAFRIDWHLALLVCMTIPLAALVLRAVDARVRMADHQSDSLGADLTGYMHDLLLSVNIVKAHNAEDVEARRFQEKQESIVQVQRRGAFFTGLSEPLIIFVTVSVILSLLLVSSAMVSNGTLRLDQLLVFMMYALMLLPLARQINLDYYRWRRIGTAMRRLDEITTLPIEKDPEGAIDLPVMLRGELAVNNVSYNYPGRDNALTGITLEVAPHEIIGIVGESGAGKSTLLNLLLRFYTPQTGTISIDGIDIQKLTSRSLRQSITIVPQDIVLFDDTILQNIRYGRQEATQEEIDAASRAAQVHEFISSLPDHYLTVVGGRGVKLSGGQRQRIAIARALLRNAPILLLDEATSSLDATTEQLLHSAMTAAMQGRTTIVIAHRLATVVRLSRILVMHKGHIIAEGTHDDLLVRCEYYADLVSHQLIPAGRESGVPLQ